MSADRAWVNEFQSTLYLAGATPEWVRTEVEAVERELAEADARATDLFGPPKEYAAARHAERPVDDVTAGVETDSDLFFRGALAACVGATLWQGVATVLREGAVVTTALEALVGRSALGLAVVAAGAGLVVHRVGRLRVAMACAGVAVTGLVAAIVLSRISLDRPVEVPLWPVMIGVVLAALAAGRWIGPRLIAWQPTDETAWFETLEGRLRGAHGVRPAAAHDRVAGLRAHWAQVRGDHPAAALPDAEFGALPRLAAELAQGLERPTLLERVATYFWYAVAMAVTIAAVRATADSSGAVEMIGRWLLVVVFGLVAAVRYEKSKVRRG